MGVFAVFSKAMLLRVPMIIIANLFCLLASTVVVITIDSALTIRRLCDSIWRSGQFGMFNRNYTLPTGIFQSVNRIRRPIANTPLLALDAVVSQDIEPKPAPELASTIMC